MSLYKLGIQILTVLTLLPFAAFGNEFSEEDKLIIRERISQSREMFSQVVESSPDQEFTATFSFKNEKNIIDIIKSVEKYNLQVVGFRHRRGDSSGGYAFKSNVNPYDAAEEYNHATETMANNLVEAWEDDLARLTSISADKDEIKNLKHRLSEMKILRKTAINGNVKISGIDLLGLGKDLENFSQRNKSLSHVAEIVRSGVDGSIIRNDVIPFLE